MQVEVACSALTRPNVTMSSKVNPSKMDGVFRIDLTVGNLFIILIFDWSSVKRSFDLKFTRAVNRPRVGATLPIYVPLTTSSDPLGFTPRKVAFGLSKNGNCGHILAHPKNLCKLFFPHKLGISSNSLIINEI